MESAAALFVLAGPSSLPSGVITVLLAGGLVAPVAEQFGPFLPGQGAADHRAGLLLPVVGIHAHTNAAPLS